jgi:transcription initiation factor TFIID TATA-box-binding protein
MLTLIRVVRALLTRVFIDHTKSVHVENVVVSTVIRRGLNLGRLGLELDKTNCNPENVPGAIYRIQTPEAATLLFRSNKTASATA